MFKPSTKNGVPSPKNYPEFKKSPTCPTNKSLISSESKLLKLKSGMLTIEVPPSTPFFISISKKSFLETAISLISNKISEI
jgi:hypothetical protein